MKDERRPLPFILHPSSFILHPSSFVARLAKDGAESMMLRHVQCFGADLASDAQGGQLRVYLLLAEGPAVKAEERPTQVLAPMRVEVAQEVPQAHHVADL